MAPIRIGLAGFGMAARVFHAPLIAALPGFAVTRVFERSAENSKAVFPNAKLVRDFDGLLANDVDLVVVTTPNTTHFDCCSHALDAGKHVICEKPFTITYEEARKLVALAKQKQRLLTVFQNRRWDGDFLTVQKIIRSGELGRVVEFESHFDRFRPQPKENAWREQNLPGSGVLYDLGSHLLDQALVLFGKPERVFADIAIQRDGVAADDYFSVTLFFNDPRTRGNQRHLRAILKSSYLVFEPGPKYVVHGTGGSFVKFGVPPQEEQLRNGMSPLAPEFGTEPEKYWGTVATPSGRTVVETQRGSYLGFYSGVADAILNGAPPPVPPDQAAEGIRLIELAKRSASEGRVVPA